MECDYTHLNHNSLMSQKKSGHQRFDYKKGLLYILRAFPLVLDMSLWIIKLNV